MGTPSSIGAVAITTVITVRASVLSAGAELVPAASSSRLDGSTTAATATSSFSVRRIKRALVDLRPGPFAPSSSVSAISDALVFRPLIIVFLHGYELSSRVDVVTEGCEKSPDGSIDGQLKLFTAEL